MDADELVFARPRVGIVERPKERFPSIGRFERSAGMPHHPLARRKIDRLDCIVPVRLPHHSPLGGDEAFEHAHRGLEGSDLPPDDLGLAAETEVLIGHTRGLSCSLFDRHRATCAEKPKRRSAQRTQRSPHASYCTVPGFGRTEQDPKAMPDGHCIQVASFTQNPAARRQTWRCRPRPDPGPC